jgi:hypothetical protein
MLLANHCSILCFHQPVVVAVSRPALGLFDQQLAQHFATVWFKNSLALSEWKPPMTKGNCWSIDSSSGSN